MILELDSRLLERAVQSAMDGCDASAYHREREALYTIAEAEERERAFAELHSRWFTRLELDRPIREALRERPRVEELARGVVSGVARAQEEGAELYVRGGGGPEGERRLVVRLRPQTLMSSGAALELLRRELFYVDDMLDPSFGYSPELPRCEAGPLFDQLLVRRYGAAWTATVLGRLARAGHLPKSALERAFHELCAAFSMPVEEARPLFRRLAEGERPPHAELLRLAQRPRAEPREGERGAACPLCGMPTFEFTEIAGHAVARATRDFPRWRRDQRVCPQCAELYRARAASERP